MKKIIITPNQDSFLEYINKLWVYKPLIFAFAKRDLQVKYAQTFLGLGWTILQPLTALLIFNFFFGFLLNWKTGLLPYPIYVLTGLLSWNFFSYIVFQGSASIQESSALIKKIYFPKAILPFSKVLVAFVELSISLFLLLPLIIWYEQPVSWRIIFIPVLIVLNATMALSIVFIIASLSYRMRDLYHLVPFLMYFGIWCTPVFFTKDILPEKLNFIWFFNPMASIVEGWRWCLFSDWNYNSYFLISIIFIFPFFIVGLLLYKNSESKFADFV